MRIGPPILRKYQYSVNRVATAIGAHTNVQVSTAMRFPKASPTKMSLILAPQFTNSTPITNSVAATCSPAKEPAKYPGPNSRSSETGSLSNS